MQFGSLLAAVSTNKIDLIISSLAITDERKKQIDFSDSYYDSKVSIIANKKKPGQGIVWQNEKRQMISRRNG